MTNEEQVKVRELVGKISDTCMRIMLETEQRAHVLISALYPSVAVSFSPPSSDSYWAIAIFDNPEYTTDDIIEKLSDMLAALEKFLADELAK